MPTPQPQKSEGLLSRDLALGGVSLTQKALFAKHLAVMLRAGITITEALTIAERTASGRLQTVLRSVSRSVRAGRSFAEALAEYPKVFPGLFTHTARAGEAAGTLAENLEYVAIQLEKEKELRGKIRGAMLYPIVVLVATFILGLFFTFWILPKITPLFEGLQVRLPASTRLVIAMSNIVQEYGIVIAVAIAVLVAAIVWVVRQPFSRPATHWVLLRLPLARRMARGANLARFCRSLGMLLRSGLHIDEALDIAKETVGNQYYRAALDSASRRVAKGVKLADTIREVGGLFPMTMVRMIEIGEASGNLEETLLYLAEFYDAEVDQATKTLSSAIEPILLLGIGSAVAFLALSIVTPIYTITGSVQR